MLDALIRKAQPLLVERLRALIARAPKDAVAIGYAHELESAAELWGEGTYSPAGGKYTLNARFKNTLRDAMPSGGRTEIVQFDARANASPALLSAPPCNENEACELLAARRKSSLFYPLSDGVAESATSTVQLARDRPVLVYGSPASGAQETRLMLCDANAGGNIVTINWRHDSVSGSAPLACLPAPPESAQCGEVVAPDGYVQNALIMKGGRLQTARAWHRPRLPLQDPPMALEGSETTWVSTVQIDGATPGCAFLFEGENSHCESRPGTASMRLVNMGLSHSGAYAVTPSAASVELTCYPRMECGWAKGQRMHRQTERIAVGELTAADFEERAKDEAARKASPALLAQLQKAAALMHELEALPLSARRAKSDVEWNAQHAKRARVLAALNALLAKPR